MIIKRIPKAGGVGPLGFYFIWSKVVLVSKVGCGSAIARLSYTIESI